jgi:O-antigen/teichoic acid export membrane protein
MYFQSKVMGKYIVYANVISLLLSSIVKIALILNEASLEAFAWTVVFDSVVMAMGYVYFYIRHSALDAESHSKFSIQNLAFKRETAVSLLKDSWPLIFAGMASMMNMRMDQVMLGNMTSSEVVGNYAAAVRIAEMWLILPMLIGSSIFPALVSAKEHSLSLYRSRIFATVKYMAIFAIPFAIVVSLLSSFIVRLLYGEAYSDADLFLAMYIWTGLPYVVLFVLSQTMVIEKLTHWSMYITIVVVVTNIALNTILIPIYQGVGAIASTLIVAYLAQGISLFIIYKKTKLFKGE